MDWRENQSAILAHWERRRNLTTFGKRKHSRNSYSMVDLGEMVSRDSFESQKSPFICQNNIGLQVSQNRSFSRGTSGNPCWIRLSVQMSSNCAFAPNGPTKADTFFIDPNKNNHRALRAYEKAGFIKIGEFLPMEGVFKENETIFMTKNIELTDIS